jgi:rhamnosyltransferase
VSKSIAMPRVGVLMATHNGGVWLLEQINSILNQKKVTINLTISDDLSSDQTPENISALISHNERISLLKRSEYSGSAGQNFFYLIRSAKVDNFDYIAFADQDDVWDENKLISGINCLKESTESGYSCSTIAFWPSGKEKLISQSSKIRELDFLFEGAGQGCTFILKKEFFLEVQRFCIQNKNMTNHFHYHDWLIYIVARSIGAGWFFDKRSFIKYRQHSFNDTGAKLTISGIKKRLRLIHNGWYKAQLLLAVNLSKSISDSNLHLDTYDKIFKMDDSILRRFRLGLIVLKSGRRKISDRVILVIAAILGWI